MKCSMKASPLVSLELDPGTTMSSLISTTCGRVFSQTNLASLLVRRLAGRSSLRHGACFSGSGLASILGLGAGGRSLTGLFLPGGRDILMCWSQLTFRKMFKMHGSFSDVTCYVLCSVIFVVVVAVVVAVIVYWIPIRPVEKRRKCISKCISKCIIWNHDMNNYRNHKSFHEKDLKRKYSKCILHTFMSV